MARLFIYYYGILAITMALLNYVEATTGTNRLDALRYHNAVRKTHHAGTLTYSQALEAYSKSIVDKCAMVHTGGIYGENMAIGFPTVTDAVKAWYNGSSAYDYNNPVFSYATGHFTQMVWKETIRIGCDINTCNSIYKGAQMLVCVYSTPGNIISDDNSFYKANVLPP